MFSENIHAFLINDTLYPKPHGEESQGHSHFCLEGRATHVCGHLAWFCLRACTFYTPLQWLWSGEEVSRDTQHTRLSVLGGGWNPEVASPGCRNVVGFRSEALGFISHFYMRTNCRKESQWIVTIALSPYATVVALPTLEIDPWQTHSVVIKALLCINGCRDHLEGEWEVGLLVGEQVGSHCLERPLSEEAVQSKCLTASKETNAILSVF